jgi:hypothetical protein
VVLYRSAAPVNRLPRHGAASSSRTSSQAAQEEHPPPDLGSARKEYRRVHICGPGQGEKEHGGLASGRLLAARMGMTTCTLPQVTDTAPAVPAKWHASRYFKEMPLFTLSQGNNMTCSKRHVDWVKTQSDAERVHKPPLPPLHMHLHSPTKPAVNELSVEEIRNIIDTPCPKPRTKDIAKRRRGRTEGSDPLRPSRPVKSLRLDHAVVIGEQNSNPDPVDSNSINATEPDPVRQDDYREEPGSIPHQPRDWRKDWSSLIPLLGGGDNVKGENSHRPPVTEIPRV